MTNEEAQKVLDELNKLKPDRLNDEAKRLFEAIIKIADERDELKKKAEEQNKIIDLMAEDIYGYQIECNRYFKDKKEVKQYFENKAKELLNK